MIIHLMYLMKEKQRQQEQAKVKKRYVSDKPKTIVAAQHDHTLPRFCWRPHRRKDITLEDVW